jgi:hypothetical protein
MLRDIVFLNSGKINILIKLNKIKLNSINLIQLNILIYLKK